MGESSDKGWPGTIGLFAMTDMDRQIKGQTKPIIMQTDIPGLTVVVCELWEGLFSLAQTLKALETVEVFSLF